MAVALQPIEKGQDGTDGLLPPQSNRILDDVDLGQGRQPLEQQDPLGLDEWPTVDAEEPAELQLHQQIGAGVPHVLDGRLEPPSERRSASARGAEDRPVTAGDAWLLADGLDQMAILQARQRSVGQRPRHRPDPSEIPARGQTLGQREPVRWFDGEQAQATQLAE